MPWKKMRLRGNDVFARVDAAGNPVGEGGRVEVHYRPGASRAYRAAVRNLEPHADAAVHPEDYCTDEDGGGAASEPAHPRERKEAEGKKPKKGRGSHVDETVHAHGGASDEVIVYADGACTGNPGPAGLGVVIIDRGRRVERSEYVGQGTNNIAELTAVQRALEAVKDPSRKIAIHTDSQYAIGVLSKGWKAKFNRELIERIRALLGERPHVRFVHVRGHAGIPLNERADQLAREAIAHQTTVERVVHDPAVAPRSAGRA